MSMEITHKDIMEHLATIKKERKDGCKTCGGKGEIRDKKYPHYYDITIPCPDCAPIRELGKICWHECVKTELAIVASDPDYPWHHHCSCGDILESNEKDSNGLSLECQRGNPDLTTEQYKIDGKPQGKLWIVHVMQVLGEWDEFEHWMWVKYGGQLVAIYIDGDKLVPAIRAYLEREG